MQFYLMFADREQAEMCLDSFLEEDNNSRSRPYRITNREKLLRMMVEVDDRSVTDFLECCKDSLSNRFHKFIEHYTVC